MVLRKYECLPNFIQNDASLIVSHQIRDYNLRYSKMNRSVNLNLYHSVHIDDSWYAFSDRANNTLHFY